MPNKGQKADLTGYESFGSCQVESWGGYVQLYRRDDNYKGDVAFFDGDRSLQALKEMHETLGRAIAVLELYQARDAKEAKESEESVKTRFDRCNE